MQVETFLCDLTDDRSAADVFAAVAAAPVDLLVACAGIGRYAPFLETSAEEWAAMLDVNLLGVVRSIRGVLPGMVKRQTGRIVLLGSRRGLEPTATTAAYSSTKAALHGLARSLSQELAPHGVHVCLLCPGGVRTNFRSPAAEKDHRFMEPADVAEAVLFMAASPARAWVRELEVLPPGL